MSDSVVEVFYHAVRLGSSKLDQTLLDTLWLVLLVELVGRWVYVHLSA